MTSIEANAYFLIGQCYGLLRRVMADYKVDDEKTLADADEIRESISKLMHETNMAWWEEQQRQRAIAAADMFPGSYRPGCTVCAGMGCDVCHIKG